MGIEQIRALKEAASGKPKHEFKKVMKTKDFLKTLPKGVVPATFANVKADYYETSKGSTYFRSKWEANYALYLDFLVKQGEIKSWEFEPDTFFFEKIKSGTKKYIPDFKVTLMDGSIEYREVKGYQVAKDKTKWRRMAKYHPTVKLAIIDASAYNKLIKQLKGIIKFY